MEAINWTLSPHSRELLKGRCHHSPGRWVIKVTSSMISKSVGNCSKNCNPPSRLVVCYRDNITIIQVCRCLKGYHCCPDWWVIKGALVPLSRLVDFKSYSMGHFSLIFMLWVTVGTQTPKSIWALKGILHHFLCWEYCNNRQYHYTIQIKIHKIKT